MTSVRQRVTAIEAAPPDPEPTIKQLDVVVDSAIYDERLTAFFDPMDGRKSIAIDRDHVHDLREVR